MKKGLKIIFNKPVKDKNGKEISELKIPHLNRDAINQKLMLTFGGLSSVSFHKVLDDKIEFLYIRNKPVVDWDYEVFGI